MNPRRWDIFCSVVDNFGDIGVCWRLARRLSAGLGQQVRLWVDDLRSFQRLCERIDPDQALQMLDGVEVRLWRADFSAFDPGDIVIEGFGVKLPEPLLAAMVAQRPAPVWINLEYLSAETWVDGHHGLPSPHPRLPLTKYFFFPGFTAATGGVLIEDGLMTARNAFQADGAVRTKFLHTIGVNAHAGNALCASLFCYENAALPSLVSAWAADQRGVDCIVPAGKALSELAQIAGAPIAPGHPLKIGQLNIHAVPFLDLDDYDHLLWSCDLNFVRGEDSFVRAQLAARPLIWQAYPQEENAHLDKVEAFMSRYCAGWPAADAGVYGRLFSAWNRQSDSSGECWSALAPRATALNVYARHWAGRLVENGDLASNLAKFCQDRLE